MLPVNSGGHTAYQTLLLKIFVNITLIQMHWPALLGISLNGFDLDLSYTDELWLINILSSACSTNTFLYAAFLPVID